MKRTINVTNGVKVQSLNERKKRKVKGQIGSDTLERIQMCLNCNKPENECKGDCFKKQKGEK